MVLLALDAQPAKEKKRNLVTDLLWIETGRKERERGKGEEIINNSIKLLEEEKNRRSATEDSSLYMCVGTKWNVPQGKTDACTINTVTPINSSCFVICIDMVINCWGE